MLIIIACRATPHNLSRTIPWSESDPDSLAGKSSVFRFRAERGLNNVLYNYGVERHRASRRRRGTFLVADLAKGLQVCCAALLDGMLMLPERTGFSGIRGGVAAKAFKDGGCRSSVHDATTGSMLSSRCHLDVRLKPIFRHSPNLTSLPVQRCSIPRLSRRLPPHRTELCQLRE